MNLSINSDNGSIIIAPENGSDDMLIAAIVSTLAKGGKIEFYPKDLRSLCWTSKNPMQVEPVGRGNGRFVRRVPGMKITRVTDKRFSEVVLIDGTSHVTFSPIDNSVTIVVCDGKSTPYHYQVEFTFDESLAVLRHAVENQAASEPRGTDRFGWFRRLFRGKHHAPTTSEV